MKPSQLVRSAVKKLLEPELAQLGFKGKYPHFQREDGANLHLLSIVHNKYGGGFVLEFAQMDLGPLRTEWGETIPQEKLEIGYAPLTARARLVQTERKQGTYEDFFRYDTGAFSRESCEELVDQVVQKLPQVNEWLRGEKSGPNVVEFAA